MKIIGHRGARGLAPENTLSSLQAALDAGVDAIEIDVRVTADARVVLSHDAYIVDAQGKKQFIELSTFHDLRSVKPDFTTLEEAMNRIDGVCDVVIEIKSPVKLTEVITLSRVKFAAGYPENTVYYASFNQDVLRDVRRELPASRLIVNEIWSSWRARRRAAELGTKTIFLLEYWVWPGFLRAMKKAGYQVYVYPSTNETKKTRFRRLGLKGCTEYPDRARRWKKAGLAGVITDHPELFSKTH